MMEYSIRDIVRAVERILNEARLDLSASLARSGFDKEWGAILPFYSNNLDVAMYPAIMIQQASESFEWHAMPSILEGTCDLALWGLVHHDDPRVSTDCLGNSAAVVSRALNKRHFPILMDNGLEITFNNHAPIKSIDYGVSDVNGVFVKSWRASFQSDVYAQVTA